MERRLMNVLTIGDDELNCNCKDKTLDDINLTMIGFNNDFLMKNYDMIIYNGTKGTKIIMSKYTKTGIIK